MTNIVFCDSRQVLQSYLSQSPIQGPVLVRTFSPYLLKEGYPGLEVEPHEKGVVGSRLRALKADIRPVAIDLYDICLRFPETAPYARTLARAAVLSQKVVVKAACLTDADFEEPRIYLFPQTGDARVDGFLLAPWDRLLHSNPSYTSIGVSIPEPESLDLANADRRVRWRHQGLEYFGFRLGQAITQRLPWLMRKDRQAFILRENELVTETAAHLAKGRVPIHKLSYGKLTLPDDMDLPEACQDLLAERLTRFAQTHLLAQKAVPTVVEHLLEEMTGHMRRQAASHQRWQTILKDKDADKKHSLILTNYPGMPEETGLFTAATDMKIPMVGFQHGVSRELNAVHGDAGIENSAAHLTLVYNQRAQEISDETQFWHWPTLSVGYPAAGKRLAKLPDSAFGQASPILYVSTNVYRGNTHMLTGSWTDYESCDFECRVIQNVLAELPYPVTYKPYPYQTRYADPDPALQLVDRCTNIDVIRNNVDMRYLIRSSRVVVSCRASSTTGWCLLADRPFVFVNVPDQMPLEGKARAAFDEALFLFDASDRDITGKLRAFLSQPLADIEAAWAGKSAARQALLRDFIDSGREPAGRFAARYLQREAFTPRFFETHPCRPPQRLAASFKDN